MLDMGVEIFLTLLVCLAAGVHAASYGAWKDSPSESYLFRRTARELIISLSVGVIFIYYQVWQRESYFIIYLSTYTFDRLITEFYKLFVRVEPQENYRIPTQIHFFGRVVENRMLRLVFGLIYPLAVMVVFLVTYFLSFRLNFQILGILTGLLIGLGDATGGAYKDGLIEGFYWNKFLKSPIFGMLGGLIVSYQTSSPFFLLMGTIAVMRMIIELKYKILSKGYVPGKFKSMKPTHLNWARKRNIFLVPYYATWLLFFVLWIM